MASCRDDFACLLLAVIVTACGSDAGTATSTTLSSTSTAASAVLPIVEQFEEAYESGDLDRVRALFTADGMITTTAHIYAWHAGDTSGVGDGFVGGPEFERLARLHAGEDLTIIGTPIEVGNTWAFGWEWSSGASGTALLHLRAGRKIVVALLDLSQTPIGSTTTVSLPTPTSALTTATTGPGSEADPPIAQEFQEAYASGDPDQVRALYTADGMITTSGGIYEWHAGNTAEVGLGFVGGPLFEELVTKHARERWWIIGTPIQVGADTVVFGWEWGSGPSGTALLHLRDGKIVAAVLDPTLFQIWG